MIKIRFMELDTNFYYVTQKKVHNPKTKETIFTTSTNNECGYFRNNYCLMEWFEKHWGISVENHECYLVDKEDIDALLKDCQRAIDIVDDVVRWHVIDCYDSLDELSNDVQNQLAKIFPMNGWRHGKKRFDGHDYIDAKDIVRVLGDIHWENTDKLTFTTNWL